MVPLLIESASREKRMLMRFILRPEWSEQKQQKIGVGKQLKSNLLEHIHTHLA